ncbi:toll/interleukin-1 receptor domain-containing protein [Xanthomonas sp. LMG 8993]|uniref:toll/interleukin-1 receptor domain-containing protein n=1 Tax=Xanthomonas TaxID=338 RepID=UPI000C8620D4|nr:MULTISPECIES: toll/interleukin-1 receptor domain-containing protein [Xanthomonas]MBB4767743.1 hypothetical protein [Xanthomonas arboricola]MXV48008.1 toll/interleukin-1 receptor domain-containing protein [Xanthomonas sp. LMG 8993]PPT17174.1 hypothetical protein XarCFBP6771_20535 [Xanthomonas arboricola]SOU08930.1 hypothetical protein LMG19145_00011 [Xanthomonas arboricola pv. fragariae]
MAIRIFVSHSAKDEKLAEAIVDFLQSSIVIDDEDLRCTSVPGHKLPVGSDSAATLRDDLGETSVVIGLVTKNALASGWVLFELGASWGAKKHLKPLLADDVDFKDLPGPLSGQHAAKLASKGDLSQLIEELVSVLGAKRRAAAKSAAAIDGVMAAHAAHMKFATSDAPKSRVETKSKEPQFAGMPFSELMTILNNETIEVPPEISSEKTLSTTSVFSMFVANSRIFIDGVQSNWDRNTGGGFLYHEVGLRLVPYGLIQFEKLPVAQAKWFKRLTISPEGNKFILQCNRLLANKKPATKG